VARALLPIPLVLWRAVAVPAPEGLAVEHLKGQLEALAVLAADLDGRLASAGVAGVGGALDVYRRVREVLDGVEIAQVERTLADVAALARRLEEVAQRLEMLRRLKSLLDG